MKRLILIGRTMAGKTSLCQYLNGEDLKYHKTQTIQLMNDKIIDTPGEYLERNHLRGALTVTAVDADYIVFIQAANEADTMFPPGYASTFGKPCIGIVTKCDLATEKQIADARNYLTAAGAKKIFITSSYRGIGFEALASYLSDLPENNEEV